MRKKIISVLMCSLLAIECIGCGGASSSSGSSSSSSSSIVSSDTASSQNKEEKQIEYRDVMKDYDNFNIANYPCTPVRVYGTVESIQSDKESESYFVKLDGKMFTVEKFSGGLDKVKVGDKVDWRGITSNDNGLVKIYLENEVAAKQEETKKEEKKDIPTEYKSALTKAKLYADNMNMSKQSIYEQLTSEYGEKFSAEAAQYAIDNLQVDYKQNALKKAQSYQESMSMSPRAIYDQLVSEYGEKFTAEEAQYAIDNLK